MRVLKKKKRLTMGTVNHDGTEASGSDAGG